MLSAFLKRATVDQVRRHIENRLVYLRPLYERRRGHRPDRGHPALGIAHIDPVEVVYRMLTFHVRPNMHY
jgi:hypothetical protein